MILQSFREAMSSDALREFVCALCSVKQCCQEKKVTNICDVNLNLLKRPDRRMEDGTVIDLQWIDSQCIGPHFPIVCPELADVLVEHDSIVMNGDQAVALLLCLVFESPVLGLAKDCN